MSKRKSVGRRRTRSLSGLPAKDFCETIPKDLPESERLLKLIEMSYKYALKETLKASKLKEDFDSNSSFAKGEEILEKAKTTVIENNLLKSAVENNGQDECHKESQWCEDMKLYKEENDKWSNLITASRKSLIKEMNSSHSIDVSTVEKFKEYNYDDIMKETSLLDRKLWQKISTLSAANRSMKNGLKLSKLYEDKLKQDCERYYHQEVSDSPRRFLKRMTAARRSK